MILRWKTRHVETSDKNLELPEGSEIIDIKIVGQWVYVFYK